jgi:putative glutamine amidotransferase
MGSGKRPLIGISCRFDTKSGVNCLRENYVEAMYAAGGLPVIVPLNAEREYIESLIERLDAICLSGSDSDINPLSYNAEPRPGLGPNVPRRDETDFLLLEGADARNLPVLGICFGIQSLNVFRGGTLIQDISTEIKDAVKHEQGDQEQRHCHSITISDRSILASLSGSTRAFVNSFHHQAIDVVGQNLEPIAWASDGIVEAVADPRRDRFVLGVQWHPERGWQGDSLSQAIFNHFVGVARDHKDAKDMVARSS